MNANNQPSAGQFVPGVAEMTIRVCSRSGCRTRENMPIPGLCSKCKENMANDLKKERDEGHESNTGRTERGARESHKDIDRNSGRTEEDEQASEPIDIPRKSVIVDANGNIGDITWREDTKCSHQLTKNICKLAGQKPNYCFECGLKVREYNRVMPYKKKGKK